MAFPHESVFRTLALCNYFEPGYRGGGPIRSMVQVVDTIPDGVHLTVVTSDRDLGDRAAYPGLSGTWVTRGRAGVLYLNPVSVRQLSRLGRYLRRRPYDLLYVNSLFNPLFSLVPIAATRVKLIDARRILIAPRGELSAGALSLKAGKKRHFLRLWLRLLARMDVVWHATSELEAADIRRVWPDAVIEVCQDQADLPELALQPAAAPVEGPARLVFISRISPMKNLALALNALTGIDAPATLDIYGPVEDAAYWAECQKIIRAMPAHITVQYRGELAHHRVRDTFAGYDAFLLPTKGENFGHVIAESLSASCPVICSANTPWTATLDDGGGIAVSPLSVQNYRAAINNVATAAPEQRLKARQECGAAYQAWRGTVQRRNIIEQVRQQQPA